MEDLKQTQRNNRKSIIKRTGSPNKIIAVKVANNNNNTTDSDFLGHSRGQN